MNRMSAYHLSPDGTVQLHAWRSDDGHWSAAFDWFPEVSFGGDTPLVAAKRLVRSAAGLDESTLRIAYRSEDGRTAKFTVLPAGGGEVCPECGGTGPYVGLAVVAECRICGENGSRATGAPSLRHSR